MDGAGRWAATCSVLPGDSEGAAWLLWGSFLSLFKIPPSLASLGQLFSISLILERLNWALGWGRARMIKDCNEDPSPTCMPTHTRPEGNFQDRVTQQGVFPSLPSLCVTPHTSFFFFAPCLSGMALPPSVVHIMTAPVLAILSV